MFILIQCELKFFFIYLWREKLVLKIYGLIVYRLEETKVYKIYGLIVYRLEETKV